MSVESATFVDDLDSLNPPRIDFLEEADNHLRLIKSVLQNTFANADQEFDMAYILQAIVPVGVVAYILATEAVPSGWHEADGSTVTRSDNGLSLVLPDIRGYYMTNASATIPAGSTPSTQNSKTVTSSSTGSHNHGTTTKVAGEHSHTGTTGSTALSLSNMPSHNHGGGSHTHNCFAVDTFASLKAVDQGVSPIYGQRQLPTTTPSTTVVQTQGSGTGHTHSVAVQAGHTHVVDQVSAGSHAHSVTVDVRPKSYALKCIVKT